MALKYIAINTNSYELLYYLLNVVHISNKTDVKRFKIQNKFLNSLSKGIKLIYST